MASPVNKFRCSNVLSYSGVAGTLAAQGGCQICRPSTLGFGNWSLFMSAAMTTVTVSILAQRICFV